MSLEGQRRELDHDVAVADRARSGTIALLLCHGLELLPQVDEIRRVDRGHQGHGGRAVRRSAIIRSAIVRRVAAIGIAWNSASASAR